jgi:signal transduction histidine kinase
VVLAIGTAFAAIGYVVLVVAIGRLVGSTTGGFWPSLLATALVALAFQPLRRRIVRLADRIAYGERAAPYEALADFSRGLGGILEPRLILPAVAEAAARAVSARRALAVLGRPGAEQDSAAWPVQAPEGGVDYTFPVQLEADTFGSITVTLPRGRTLRSSEQRLLGHLADQTALSLRNASMDADLQRHLVELDRRAQALAESRGRILAARDSERRRLEAAVTREVTSHLTALPGGLGSVPEVDRADLPGQIGEWLERTTDALESLRELTRGVFPTQLERVGLGAALTSYAARHGLAGLLTVDPSMSGRRFDPHTETAAYFCFVEALGADGSATGDIAVRDGDLVLRVDGARTDMDVQAMADRVEAVGGSLSIDANQQSVQLRVLLPAEASAVGSPSG